MLWCSLYLMLALISINHCCYVSYILFNLIPTEFLSWRRVGVCKKLFLILMRWSYGFCLSVCLHDEQIYLFLILSYPSISVMNHPWLQQMILLIYSLDWFETIFIRYFLHFHFQCYPKSPPCPPVPLSSPRPPPTPTSWPWRSPVLRHIKFARTATHFQVFNIVSVILRVFLNYNIFHQVKGLLLFLFVLYFWDRVSLRGPGSAEMQRVDQAVQLLFSGLLSSLGLCVLRPF